MSDLKRDTADARRRMRAAVWFTRWLDGGLTAREQRFWEAWRALPENQRAFDAISELWQALGDLRRREASTAPAHRGFKRIAVKAAACIAVLIVAAGGGLALMQRSAPVTVLQTSEREWQTWTLEDHTVVRAGPRTSLEIELSGGYRKVRLADGDAYFKVAKDPARPFVVTVDEFSTRAVGTEFAISRKADGGVSITVAEGVVAVSRSESIAGAVKLSAGEGVIVKGASPIVPRRVDVANALAWRDRRLVLDGESLETAVSEFNRRNSVQLEIADPALAAKKVVRGTFQLDDPQTFARMLEKTGLVVIVREGPNLLRLEPRPSQRSGENQ